MRTSPQPTVERGFHDPVMESQAVFRLCLEALSRPCRPIDIGSDLPSLGALTPATLSIVLALADYETRIWLDPKARAGGEIGNHIRFHTGASLCEDPGEADFAVVVDAVAMPPLSAFKQGTLDYPDNSTTLLMQVGRFHASGPTFKGPGINGAIAFWADPLPQHFPGQIASNRRSFPCGVDMIFIAESQVAGLPRSTVIQSNGTISCTLP